MTMSFFWHTRTMRSVALVGLLLSLAATTTRSLTIAITGTSQGIGLDAASRLISEGHTVIHACRNRERAEVAVKMAGGGIPMVCDLSSFESIRSFAESLQTTEEMKLDVLCLNAAVAPSTKAVNPKLTKDGLEECIGTNHLGHFLLANILKDHLAKGVAGGKLVVTASSVHDPEAPGGAVGGKGGATLGDLSGLGIQLDKNPNGPTMPDGLVEYDGGKIYKDSKLCNVLFCREAQKRWEGSGISIRSLNPGFIPSSGLFREPRKDNWLGASIFTFVAGVIGFAVPISVGGERLAYMATADESEVPSGSYFSAKVGSKAATKADGFDQDGISKEASNDELATKLWERSMEIVQLSAPTK
jgi:light-dependent protochlorophyllide reductase